MELYITAQIIGFIGYIFYVGAPHFKTQINIMKIGALACSICMIQWYMLGQLSLLAFNFLSIITLLIAIKGDRKYSYLLYPIGCAVIISMSSGTIIDILALCAFCLSVASQFSQNIITFRLYAAIAGAFLIISGALALSLPALIFNILFAYGHILKLRELSVDSSPTETKICTA